MAAIVIAAINARNAKEAARDEAETEEKQKSRRQSQFALDQRVKSVLGPEDLPKELDLGEPPQPKNRKQTIDIKNMTPTEIAYAKYDYAVKDLPPANCCGWTAPMKYRKQVYVLYNGDVIQLVVASLIMINFVVNAAEAQVKTYPLEEGQEEPKKEGQEIFDAFEMFFTIVFTIELVVNMYAHWWKEFWFSGWNLFDFIVVVISIITVIFSGLPGVRQLRLLRAFRVFRLFKRIESLRKILKALENAVPGCTNAFAIVVLVNSIFSIMGVELFKDSQAGPYFKNFSAAMFTMFQIMTGDSWAEAIARPIIDEWPWAAIFFIAYILLVGIVLVNVVIAVLLEKMVDDGDDDEEEDAEDTAWLETNEVEDLAPPQPSPRDMPHSPPPDVYMRSSLATIVPEDEELPELSNSPESKKRRDSASKKKPGPRAKRASVMDMALMATGSHLLKDQEEEKKKAKANESMFFGGRNKFAQAAGGLKQNSQDTDILQSHLILTLIEKVDKISKAQEAQQIALRPEKEFVPDLKLKPLGTVSGTIGKPGFASVPETLPPVASLDDAIQMLKAYGVTLLKEQNSNGVLTDR